MITDLGTLYDEGYASGGELLPGVVHAALGAMPARSVARLEAAPEVGGDFARSDERYETVKSWLGAGEAGGLEHGELEQRLQAEGRELLRLLFQDHLTLRAAAEQRVTEVRGADGVRRGSVERCHERPLASVFGEVSLSRIAYRARGAENLYPADGQLNLPQEKHSHGLRRLAAIEAPRGSFEDASEAIFRQTGQRVANRQLHQLALRAAVDFECFYEQRDRDAPAEGDALVLSCDGKGVVMRPEALREHTKRQAENSERKLRTRLSRGEKHGRKRMAEVCAVYEITPVARTPADILPATEQEREDARDGPKAKNKWLSASVTDDAAKLITRMFQEAERRDPEHQYPWVALVDGNRHQIDRINTEAKSAGSKSRSSSTACT